MTIIPKIIMIYAIENKIVSEEIQPPNTPA